MAWTIRKNMDEPAEGRRALARPWVAKARRLARASIHGGQAEGFRFLDADGNELLGARASTWWPAPPASAPPAPRKAERLADATPHSAHVLADVRAALRTMQCRDEEAKKLLAHVLPRLPADATASQIVTAILQARR